MSQKSTARSRSSEMQSESGRHSEKRTVKLSRKALENAFHNKLSEAQEQSRKLRDIVYSYEQSGEGNGNLKHLESELELSTERYEIVMMELTNLCQQDTYHCISIEDKESLIDLEKCLNNAQMIFRKMKSERQDASSQRSKAKSNRASSRKSSISNSSSSVRLRARAEAAAAKERAAYELAIADHAREIAILEANQKAAVANAKLKLT